MNCLKMKHNDKYKNCAIMTIELEILNASYWEHFKYAKELAGYLDLNHPKRVRVKNELNKMLERIHQINDELKH